MWAIICCFSAVCNIFTALTSSCLWGTKAVSALRLRLESGLAVCFLEETVWLTLQGTGLHYTCSPQKCRMMRGPLWVCAFPTASHWWWIHVAGMRKARAPTPALSAPASRSARQLLGGGWSPRPFLFCALCSLVIVLSRGTFPSKNATGIHKVQVYLVWFWTGFCWGVPRCLRLSCMCVMDIRQPSSKWNLTVI